MFEISKIKKQAGELAAESSKRSPDFNKEKIYLNDLADEIGKVGLELQAMKGDLYQFKNFFSGLNKCLPELEALKGEEFAEVIDKANHVLILTKDFEKNPQKALEEYGGLSTFKAGLVQNLGRLRVALKNAAAREELVAKRRKAYSY